MFLAQRTLRRKHPSLCAVAVTSRRSKMLKYLLRVMVALPTASVAVRDRFIRLGWECRTMRPLTFVRGFPPQTPRDARTSALPARPDASHSHRAERQLLRRRATRYIDLYEGVFTLV